MSANNTINNPATRLTFDMRVGPLSVGPIWFRNCKTCAPKVGAASRSSRT